MSFESFDVTMLIENSAFLPQAQPAEAGDNRGPTLDYVLQQVAAVARDTIAIDRQTMREAMREATALDLWVERASGTAFTALNSHEGEQPAPLRKLSPDEMALIAGGSGSDMNGEGGGGGGYGGSDVLVIGPYWDWSFPNNDPGDQYPSGSGSPGVTDYLEQYYNQCELDNMVDFKAQQISNLIKEQPDWNEREHAAVIYMVNGEIRMGPLLRGMTVAEAQAAGLNAPSTAIYAPADLGDGIILAVVHSHPDVGFNSDADVRNRYPSSHANGDYAGFEALVGSDPRFSNNAVFAQYILGPDGLLREFNAKDGRITSANDANPDGRTNLAADRPCSQ